MDLKTHRKASPRLVGRVVSLEEGVEAVAELETVDEMAVDEHGLVHGGFTFSLADYAAMTAVNHPYVVLGGADCRFVAPVKAGETMVARASVRGGEGRRRDVEVEVSVGEKKVFEGIFKCYVLDKHVFE
ncbi:thioesterase [Candidatus Bathyarchaeota archaeon]|nr:thioesterase [Candidatus Bathyarchaeota archaeon]